MILLPTASKERRQISILDIGNALLGEPIKKGEYVSLEIDQISSRTGIIKVSSMIDSSIAHLIGENSKFKPVS